MENPIYGHVIISGRSFWLAVGLFVVAILLCRRAERREREWEEMRQREQFKKAMEK